MKISDNAPLVPKGIKHVSTFEKIVSCFQLVFYCLALTVTINVIESFVEAVHYTLNFNLRNKKIYGLVGPANMPYESIDLKKHRSILLLRRFKIYYSNSLFIFRSSSLFIKSFSIVLSICVIASSIFSFKEPPISSG